MQPTRGDLYWMGRAIVFARHALSIGEIPFGCVIVGPGPGQCLACAWGTGTANPVVHSETTAIQHACERNSELGIRAPGWLRDCTLYSTHELCSMCAGAANHAKLSRVVFGSYRSDLPHLFRAGISSERLLANTSHPPDVLGGVCRQECIDLLIGVKKWD